jgi:hypothetical protein
MAFDVASELKAKIAKENDEERRTFLLLLLGVFEANLAGLAAIGKKIDDLISDEASLRDTVLNGHAENHDRDHEFVGQLYQHRESAAEERRWVRERMGSQCAEACGWAEKKMHEERQAEIEAKETAKADKRAARDALIRQGVVILLTVAATVTGTLWVVK